jgi:hypothetical protein
MQPTQVPPASVCSPPFELALLVVVPEPPSLIATAVESDLSIRPASSAQQLRGFIRCASPVTTSSSAVSACAPPTASCERSRGEDEDQESCCNKGGTVGGHFPRWFARCLPRTKCRPRGGEEEGLCRGMQELQTKPHITPYYELASRQKWRHQPQALGTIQTGLC